MITVSEFVEKYNLTRAMVYSRIINKNIKPVGKKKKNKSALYRESDLERLCADRIKTVKTGCSIENFRFFISSKLMINAG